MTDNAHYSVLLSESVRALITEPDAIYIDGTFGRGGHSRAILGNLSDQGRLLAVDKDPQAVEVAQQLAQQDPRFNIVHGSFAELESITEQANCKKQVAGVLLDLGVSSPQLDQAERGFSFMRDGPLDMRMNTEDGVSAAQWINTVKQEELIRVFKEYGEERFAKRIASAICERREQRAFERTLDLAEVVSAANPKWERDKHPATRVFQAIRIEVNKELTDLEQVLESAISVLAPGGRIVIISFHSLEDRIVKRFFKLKSQGKQFPRDVPVTEDMLQKELRILGKAVKAGEQELDENIRSRSAVMRVAEKL